MTHVETSPSVQSGSATVRELAPAGDGDSGGPGIDPALKSAYAICRRMQRRHDPTFYLATLRLPAGVRPAVHAVYGYVRAADEIVDGAGLGLDPQVRIERLDRLGSDLKAAIAGESGAGLDPTALALADAGLRHHLPLGHLDLYLDSMKRDIRPLQISDWGDLESYMAGSAGSVGRIMAPLLGAPEPTHESFARLGLAFQLTNFIRDIPEDTALGRVYLPGDELLAAGVGAADLAAPNASQGLREVIATQVGRARELFVEGDEGSNAVSPRVRRGVLLARSVYERTLDRVESLRFDTLGNRASLPPLPLMAAVIAGIRGSR